MLPSKAGGGGGGLLHGHDAQVHDLAQDLSGGIALLSGSLHVALLAIQDPHDPVHPGLLSQRIFDPVHQGLLSQRNLRQR